MSFAISAVSESKPTLTRSTSLGEDAVADAAFRNHHASSLDQGALWIALQANGSVKN